MKRILFTIFILLATLMHAQVGINTPIPNASSMLDVQSTDKGILIPRVALTGTADATTITPANVEGLLVYNTATVGTITPGYYYWSGSTWLRMQTEAATRTQVMMRNFTATGIGGSGTIFNFPNQLFSNITGASFNTGTNRIILPRGLYLVESDLRLNSNNTIDWNVRLNGTVVATGASGSSNPAGFNTNAGTIKQLAVIEITAATGELDFTVTGGSGATILNQQTHVLIQKIQ